MTNTKETEVGKVKVRKRDRLIVTAVILIVVIGVLGGIYFSYVGNSKRIVSSAIDQLAGNIKQFIAIDDSDAVSETFTLKNHIKLDVQSDYLSAISSYSPEYQPYLNLINNISKLDTNVTITQQQKDQKLLAVIDSSLSGNKLLDLRYLVDGHQQYYFVKDFLTTYIRNGDSDYFENLEQNASFTEDGIYIYDFAIESLKKNLKDSYFSKKKVTTTISTKDTKATEVSFTLDNEVAKELANNVLKDLKKDKRATKILASYNKDFSDAKVAQDASILASGQQVILSVYTDPLTYQVKKYQLQIVDAKDTTTITYEEGVKESVIEVYQNKTKTSRVILTGNDQNMTAIFQDGHNQKIGTMILQLSDLEKSLKVDIAVDEVALAMELTSKSEEPNKEKNYKIKTHFTFLMTASDIHLADIKATIDSEFSNQAKINEDVTTAVSQTTLTKEQQQALQEQLAQLFVTLMS